MTQPGLEFLAGPSGPAAQEAFAAFVEQHSELVRTAVRGTLLRYTHRAEPDRVDDLHNGLFLRLMEDDFRRLRGFRGRSSLATYLRVIATRHVIDVLRRQRTDTSLDLEPVATTLTNPTDTPEQHLEQAEQVATLQRAIAQLRPRERLLLRLVYDRELLPAQVCGVLGITMSAYYNQKSRLLKKMRQLCEKPPATTSLCGGRRQRD